MNYSEREVFTRHGGAYDRGSADAYYGREYCPHYFVADTYRSEEVLLANMTVEEILAYTAGYNETPFGQKFWG